MKKFYHILGAALIAPTISFGQGFGTTQFDHNDCNAQLNANGVFFNHIAETLAGYTVPKEDSVPSIYSMNMMVFGDDINGQLHGAIANYENSDFHPGPIANNYLLSSYMSSYGDGLWKVSKAEIDNHIANWNTVGYVTPTTILNWPGNGDVANGEAGQLAPFEDVNADGIYDPAQGDYPLIRGNQAVYCILNDRNGVHNSGSDPMSIEFHFMFYQFSSLGDIMDQTTFIQTKLFNRGTITFDHFKFGGMIDFDLGNFSDDYMGTDLQHNMTYVYNGDLMDESYLGRPSFMENPPAVGLMVLNRSMHSNIISSVLTVDPGTAEEYEHLLSGRKTYGEICYDNNGQQTPFIYTDTVTDPTGWNEYALNQTPGERRSYFSVEDNDGVLYPGEFVCTDFAIVYARSSGGAIFSSVDSLFQVATEVQSFYDNQSYPCTVSTLGLKENTTITATVYPNPATELIFIDGINAGNYSIISADGRIISKGKFSGESIDIKSLPQGFYQLIIETESGSTTANFVK